MLIFNGRVGNGAEVFCGGERGAPSSQSGPRFSSVSQHEVPRRRPLSARWIEKEFELAPFQEQRIYVPAEGGSVWPLLECTLWTAHRESL